MISTTTDKLVFAFSIWLACMLIDYGAYQIGVFPGTWHWKRALITFGIGTIIVIWLFGPK